MMSASSPQDRFKSSRRDFLTVRSGLSTEERLSSADGIPVTSDEIDSGQARPGYLIEVTRKAMACTFAVLLNAQRHSDATELALQALDLVERLEQQLSIYRPTSEVSEINRNARDSDHLVEPSLGALIGRALDLSRRTAGAFDITSGPLGRIWGFHRREGRLPSDEEILTSLSCVNYENVMIDVDMSTVRFRQPGVEINFNAIGKGYALDRCARLLDTSGLHDFVIHGGKSSILARGSRAASISPGWLVDLRHPLRPDQAFLRFRLHNQALGTSGDATQHFYHQGKRHGHILDPRTGWPATGVISSTVIATSAETADALATAFYVMGPDEVDVYCREHENLAAIITTPTKKSGGVKLHVFGLADDKWEMLSSPQTVEIA